MVALDQCRSLDECLDRLARAASSEGDPGWLLARAVRPESWPEHRWPTLAELDRVCPDRPLAIWCFDHHALGANSRALSIAQIGAETPDPAGGVIERDREGHLTGLLLESATRLVWSCVPEPTDGQRREHVRLALADLSAKGFVEVHDMLSHEWLGPVLADLRRSGDLRCAVWLYPLVESLPRIASERSKWESDEVMLAGGKVFTDGTINSRTASVLLPYADPIPSHPRGTALMTVDEIADAVRVCQVHGLHLAAHAIGDAAVRACLDAAEQTATQGRVWLRIEHAELIDGADVPRFAKLGVVASVQPCHLLADIEALHRLLPHRLERVLPLRELVDAGCRPGELLWFGSDTPIVRPDAEDSVQAAVHRRRVGMDATEAIAPGQALTEAEAMACFAPTRTR